MRKHFNVCALVAALVGALVFSASAFGARPPDKDPGTDAETSDYGDLFVLYRDSDGLPIVTGDFCQQPLAAAAFEGCINIPSTDDCRLIPVDPETCAVLPEYAIYTQEVDFGRVNEIRADDSVLDAQLEEALLNLATSGCVGFDPAGRPVYSSLTDLGVVSNTVDSPLQNLAMYRKLMLEGTLGENVPIPGGSVTWEDMAARALGAAADKAGKLTDDMIAYVNEMMGLVDEGANPVLGKLCRQVKEEVMGEIRMVNKCVVDFRGFTYNRQIIYGPNPGSLPMPPYIPEDDPHHGWFEYLVVATEEPLTFEIAQGPVVDAVPELLDDPVFMGTNLAAFTAAADDARGVIEFMHSWPVPGSYATEVTCEVGTDIYYDVSISADSGLQVPVRMVAGTEGREGTLTVINAGPAEATGTVTLTAVDKDGALFTGPFYRVVDGLATEEPVFDGPEEFTLSSGHSTGWIFFFSVDTPTTITWTATADAEFDVNLSNNEVVETTVVTNSKGGGGH
jgi:hypothetical protein